MKGQKNKKKYNVVHTPDPLNPQLINELKLLNETYQKHFISLINIKRDATNTKDAIAKKTVVAEANKLQNEILNILKSSTEIVKNHPIIGSFSFLQEL
ncbi:hypothetical protein [uncultured Legionella sp.]|mgnify:CR=1 FL=1|uniref:hypothetical protein n=1 Tax=uncultured Legionella sp. TaxID=210934 RepID=UPI00260E71E5|nr:hypothetical protein [uncultured Legionella sp.]